jgi:hypothetical protein
MSLVIAPEYRQAGSYLFARRISPDKLVVIDGPTPGIVGHSEVRPTLSGRH